jgi:hypothetical protein
MALPKIKKGDVFEIVTSKGMGYFQCVQETPANECELIRVFKGVFPNEEAANIDKLVTDDAAYFIQFPLKYGVKKKVIRLVENYDVPANLIVPQIFRTKHIVRGEFIAWHIVDCETLMRKSVKQLTDDQKKLSPFGMWNDTLLAERIANGWSLEDWV